MPTREDVDLARAAIDRGFLTVEESVQCLKIQRDYSVQGRHVPLERIFLDQAILTEAQLTTLKESLARLAARHRIGHYEILSKLGAGGMGTVYKAKDTVADREVALKVLSPGHASNKEYVQRFLREARASGQLSHPNIVQGFDAGEAGGEYYFAMEYIDGVTVGDMLRDGRPVPEQQVLDIAIQVAKALEHAEENRLIHRDVKPDNLMITKDGTAKLADLGLAKLATEGPINRERVFGTPYYVSPEQCEGTEELDTKSDMYSFGATLFHMLAGHVPFDDESADAIMVKHLREKPPYLKDLNVQLSHGVSKVVRKLMAKQKRGRYPSMQDVVKDLTLVRMGRSPRLGERSRYDSGEYRYRSSTGSWRTRRPSKWRKIGQIAACVAIGLLILLGAVIIFRQSQSKPPPPDPKKNHVTRPPRPAGPPPRPDHQIFYEDQVLKPSLSMPRQVFYKKLLEVAEKFPGTESARLAAARAREVLKAIEHDAERPFLDRKTRAEALAKAHRYGDALKALEGFPTQYRLTRFARQLEDLKTQTTKQAQAEFRRIQTEARRLAEAKQFDEAAALYAPVAKTFGMPDLIRQAEEAAADLKRRKADEQRQLDAEAERQRQLELARKEAALIAATAKTIPDLVAGARFGQAAEALETLAGKLSDADKKAALAGAIKDLDELGKLIAGLKKARKELQGKAVTLTRKDGSTLKGKIFGVGRRLSIETSSRAIRTAVWGQLSPPSICTLAELKSGGRPAAAERAALALLLHFSGLPAEAQAQLKALGADAEGQAGAELRRKYFALLTVKKDE